MQQWFFPKRFGICFCILSNNDENLNETHEHVQKGHFFKLYCLSLSLCFIFVTVRTCYRIAEYSEGWINSPIYYEETYFMILEALMMLLTSALLACFHPGVVFGKDNLQKIDKFMKLSGVGKKKMPEDNPFSDEHETFNLENPENATPISIQKSEENNPGKKDFNIPLPILGTIIKIVRYLIRSFRK